MPDGVDTTTGAVVALLATLAVLAIAIGMDARRLPLGRVKYVPWTYITPTALLAALVTAGHLLRIATS